MEHVVVNYERMIRSQEPIRHCIIRRNPAEGKAVHQIMVKLLQCAIVGLIIGINYEGAWF